MRRYGRDGEIENGKEIMKRRVWAPVGPEIEICTDRANKGGSDIRRSSPHNIKRLGLKNSYNGNDLGFVEGRDRIGRKTTEKNDQPLLDITPSLSRFSPDGAHAAVAKGNRLWIFRTPYDQLTRFDKVSERSTVGDIEAVEWSQDSALVLCGQFKSETVQIFSMRDTSWAYCIRMNMVGIHYSSFAPDSLHVVTVSNFGLYLNVRALTTERQQRINTVKIGSTFPGFEFNSETLFLAVLQRKDCKDNISIYGKATGWKRLLCFPVSSMDAEELSWSPNSDAIVVRDNPIAFAVFVYNPNNGDQLGRLKLDDVALGARSLAWTKNGSALAVGDFNKSLRILTAASWKATLEYGHPTAVSMKNQALRLVANCFEDYTTDNLNNELTISKKQTADPELHKLQLEKGQVKNGLPRKGIFSIKWSFDSKFLASRDEESPSVVWILTSTNLEPYAILDFSTRVYSIAWSSCRNRLAVVTGETCAFIWEPTGSKSSVLLKTEYLDSVSNTTEKQPCVDVNWHPNGELILISGKEVRPRVGLQKKQVSIL